MDSAIAKAFGLLEALSRAKGSSRLSTLAAELGLQKSTVHRVLSELTELGYVEQDESGLYRPTLRTWEIGTAVVADLAIKQVASGALQQLHDLTGETVSLTVRSGDDALYLDKIVSPRPVRFTTRVGSRVPLPITASGKALLANAPDAEAVIARVAQRPELHGLLDPERTLRQVIEARKKGYAISAVRPGILSVAAAVHDRSNDAVAALAVSSPTERLPRSERARVIEAVLNTSLQLAESLGRM